MLYWLRSSKLCNFVKDASSSLAHTRLQAHFISLEASEEIFREEYNSMFCKLFRQSKLFSLHNRTISPLIPEYCLGGSPVLIRANFGGEGRDGGIVELAPTSASS